MTAPPYELPLLVNPSLVASVLGLEEGNQRVYDATRTASAIVRGYTRCLHAPVEDHTVYLPGTTLRRLDLPEPPVTAVSAVVLDGVTLDADDFTWQRSGALYRSLGWGDSSVEVVVTYDHGALVPNPVSATALLIACRVYPNPSQYDYRAIPDAEANEDGERQVGQWRGGYMGLTLTERITLDRYRRRYAA